eukprot:gene37955-46112_t
MVKAKRARKDGSADDYASKSYWDSRYEANAISHEWYYSFDILQPLLSLFVNNGICSADKALEIGCGDRPLVDKFTQLGFTASSLNAVDYSKVVIDMLRKQQIEGSINPDVHFEEADARNMPAYQPNSFTMILDKGTTDAMLSSKSRKEGIRNAKQIFSEIVRILALNGTFVLVSHMEVESEEFDTIMSEVFMPILHKKTTVNWFVKAHIVGKSNFFDEKLENSPKGGKDKKRKADEIKEDDQKGYGTVYTFTSQPKRVTRNKSPKSEVTFEVLEYDEDEEEEVYCLPCSS